MGKRQCPADITARQTLVPRAYHTHNSKWSLARSHWPNCQHRWTSLAVTNPVCVVPWCSPYNMLDSHVRWSPENSSLQLELAVARQGWCVWIGPQGHIAHKQYKVLQNCDLPLLYVHPSNCSHILLSAIRGHHKRQWPWHHKAGLPQNTRDSWRCARVASESHHGSV